MSREGVLLVNSGTPDAPEPRAVRRFLREFLSDPRVIDIPAVPRWLLLNLIILPRRPKRSAAAYREIWTDRGSPLLVHALDLAERLREANGGPVEVGMRYGRPSIASALDRLAKESVDRVVVLPLFPQWSSAAWESAVVRVRQESPARSIRLVEVPPYYDHPAYLDTAAAVSGPALEPFGPDHVLFSFHGLPFRQLERVSTRCRRDGTCCETIGDDNERCYRAQCVATARGLAERLGLADDAFEIAFQSRLGRAEWIRPYTADRIESLPAEGVRRLAVLTPSFVSDGLETLEEIGLRGREAFRAAGGEDLLLVPSLNAHPAWVEAIVILLRATS